VQIFVQTRGAARASDYCFLGQAPHTPWWRTYRDQTTFDHPTLIMHSDGSGWQAYLSGIPSTRVDAVGTAVRYTVALEGACGAAEAAANAPALAIIAAWLSDIGRGISAAAPGQVQSAFDREFPGQVVERLLGEGRDGIWPEAQQRALAAVRSLPAVRPGAGGRAGSWIGEVAAQLPRAEFLSRAAELFAGAPGRALFLNLIGSREDGAALAQDGLPVAILGDDITGTSGDDIAELSPKKAPPSLRLTRQVTAQQTMPRRATRKTSRRPSLLGRLMAWFGGRRRRFP